MLETAPFGHDIKETEGKHSDISLSMGSFTKVTSKGSTCGAQSETFWYPRDSPQACQETEGDVRAADVECFLSETMAAKLVREWKPQKNTYSGQWQTLVQHQRPFLMELACYSDSLLSGEVLQRFGQGLRLSVASGMGATLKLVKGWLTQRSL